MISPKATEDEAKRQEEPGNQSPKSGDTNPFRVELVHQKCSEPVGEGDGEGYIARQEARRVEEHRWGLQKGVHPIAVCRTAIGEVGFEWIRLSDHQEFEEANRQQ